MLIVLLLAASAESSPPIAAKVTLSSDAGVVAFMGWDTEGTNRHGRNLLREDVPFSAGDSSV